MTSSRKVISHLCPNCEQPIRKQIQIYGQKSYDCDNCSTFGPWTKTKRVRVNNGGSTDGE